MTASVGLFPQSAQVMQCGRFQGGRGDPEQELLDDVQEECFRGPGGENGVIEHGVKAGGATGAGADPSP